jgi:hypothetical protein
LTRAEDPFAFWWTITPLLPYLGRADSNNTIGVQDATLYDILDDNNGIGNVTIGAKAFNVTCGSLPNTQVFNLTTAAGQQVWEIWSAYNNFVLQNVIDGQGKKIVMSEILYSANQLVAPNVLGPIVYPLGTKISGMLVRKH